MVAGLEQALVGMSAGGVRQVLVPYDNDNNGGGLSYPASDPEHDVVGPKPTVRLYPPVLAPPIDVFVLTRLLDVFWHEGTQFRVGKSTR